MEELIWNSFDFGINNGSHLIVDEHELPSLESFIAFSHMVVISFLFSIFNRVSAASSDIVNFSIRLYITFASDFLAFSMFDEKSMPFFGLLNFWSFFEIENYS
jgi:hypothetical protein